MCTSITPRSIPQSPSLMTARPRLQISGVPPTRTPLPRGHGRRRPGLLVLFVGDEVGSGTPNQPTVSGNSVAWTAIKTINVGVNRLTLFAANSAGSAAGATTVDFAGQSQSGCEATFFHITNVDLSGGVAAAFVQSPTGSGAAGSGSITLASPGNSANRPVSGWFHAAQEGTNPRANWAEADGGSHNNPGTGVESRRRADAVETTASASW